MRRTATSLLACLTLAACPSPSEPAEPARPAQPAEKKTAAAAPDSLWELETNSLAGETVALDRYRGKLALVVNVASNCGYTPQYAGLQKLWETYGERGLVILGFPSNEFGGQEPGSPEEIAAFCDAKYGVSFPMFEKVQVKRGDGQSPIYAFLTKKVDPPAWNFTKYLVGPEGQLLSRHESAVTPEDLIPVIEAKLPK